MVSWLLRLLTAFYICRLTSFTNWENIHSLLLIFLFLRLRIPKPRTVCMLGKRYSAIISQRGEKSSPPSSPFFSWSPGFCPWVSGAVAPVCVDSLALSWLSLASTKGFFIFIVQIEWSGWPFEELGHTAAFLRVCAEIFDLTCLWLSGCLASPSTCRRFVSFFLWYAMNLPLFTQTFFLYPHIVTHTNHPSTQVAEAGRLWVQAHSLLHERTLSQTKTKEKTF